MSQFLFCHDSVLLFLVSITAILNRFNNSGIVWLRDLECNTTEQTCFKNCYEAPSIRNIYCGNVDNVELECSKLAQH